MSENANIIIKVGKDGIERALKKYKNKFRNYKIGEDLRERKEYTKKSVKKRQQKIKAVYLTKKNNESED